MRKIKVYKIWSLPDVHVPLFLRACEYRSFEWNGCTVVERNYGSDETFQDQISVQELSKESAESEMLMLLEGLTDIYRFEGYRLLEEKTALAWLKKLCPVKYRDVELYDNFRKFSVAS